MHSANKLFHSLKLFFCILFIISILHCKLVSGIINAMAAPEHHFFVLLKIADWQCGGTIISRDHLKHFPKRLRRSWTRFDIGGQILHFQIFCCAKSFWYLEKSFQSYYHYAKSNIEYIYSLISWFESGLNPLYLLWILSQYFICWSFSSIVCSFWSSGELVKARMKDSSKEFCVIWTWGFWTEMSGLLDTG